jgi:phospholipase/carboxylesterase
VARLTVRGRARVTRRRLIGTSVASVGAVVTSSCADLVKGSFGMARNSARGQSGETAQDARLPARPTQPTGDAPLGLQPLGLAGGRDGLLYVPVGYRPDRPAPLVLSLHGAGGNEKGGLYPLESFADEVGLILLSPASRGRTWDLLLDDYGPDVAYIDRALSRTFERYAVDPARLAVGGFSDGASYALSIGLTNGDLFTHVLAFSPGFAAPAARRGAPRLYVSHGTRDEVLPIDACSRRIVPMVRRAGYDVRYHEFEGPHTVPPEIAREALDWFLAA